MSKEMKPTDEWQKVIDDHMHDEIMKCIESPYYMATKYMTVNGEPFTTMMSEEEFNEMVKNGPGLLKKGRR